MLKRGRMSFNSIGQSWKGRGVLSERLVARVNNASVPYRRGTNAVYANILLLK